LSSVNLSEESMIATRMKSFLGGLALLLAASSCATESTTVRTMSESQDQTPAAVYPVPKTDPKGTAYVMSLGREFLVSPSGAKALYLHLRVAAENKSDAAAWTLDAHDQVVNLGAGPVQPTYAQGSAGTSVVTVAPGQHGYLDLFYALPAGNTPAQAVLGWQVRRGTEVVADSAPFQLQSAQTPDYAYYQPMGTVEYWPAWWWGVGFYGPWWWGPGWGPYPYGGYGYHGRGGFGHGYIHPGSRGGGWHTSPPPPPARGFGGGGRGRFPGGHR
jgi:hypothetical protein